MKGLGKPHQNNLGSQSILEFILAFTAIAAFVVGITRIWVWFDANYAGLQLAYQKGRLYAGQPKDPYNRPLNIGGSQDCPDCKYEPLDLTEEWVFAGLSTSTISASKESTSEEMQPGEQDCAKRIKPIVDLWKKKSEDLKKQAGESRKQAEELETEAKRLETEAGRLEDEAQNLEAEARRLETEADNSNDRDRRRFLREQARQLRRRAGELRRRARELRQGAIKLRDAARTLINQSLGLEGNALQLEKKGNCLNRCCNLPTEGKQQSCIEKCETLK